jgi:N-acyl-D-amino-acid deacylase
LSQTFGQKFEQSTSTFVRKSDAHRIAIQRGMDLLRASVDRYPQHRQCFSCHHQAVPLLAFRLAVPNPKRASTFPWDKDAERVQQIVELTRASLKRDLEASQDDEELDGRGLTLGYAMWALDVADAEPDELTDALIDRALATQREDGRWRIHSQRPPASSSDRMATALVCSSLLKHAGRHPREAEVVDALHRARWWHLNRELPSETEDLAGMLWCNYVFEELDHFHFGPGYGGQGSLWSRWQEEHLNSEERARIHVIEANHRRVRTEEALWMRQNADGGWGQRLGDESDAYATALSIVVLVNATNDYYKGTAFSDLRYRRGISWLIENQLEDGSWHVSSRAIPVQEFFDNGDPHESDQFISMLATGWATAALCNAWHRQVKPLTTRE